MPMIVEDAGLLTTVQDLGRYGCEKYGLSPSGPMDESALRLCNLLVGNEEGEGALEVTMFGPRLRFTEEAVIAVTGGDLSAARNGQTIPRNCAVSMHSGDLLSFGAVKSGCRAYVAVSGGLAIAPFLGSVATLDRYGIGGQTGHKLKRGDTLPLRGCKPLSFLGVRKAPLCEEPEGVRTVRVMAGPQADRFSPAGREAFYSGVFTVGQDSDRMGYRLEGPKIQHLTDGNIISDGVVMGSVQVPSSGEPIIMMAEHQTVGGYTKIATVITVDLPVVGQCKAGDRIRFQKVSLEEAHALLRKARADRQRLKQQLEQKIPTAEPNGGSVQTGCAYAFTWEPVK